MSSAVVERSKVHMTTTMPHYVAGTQGKTTAQITPRAVDVPSTSSQSGDGAGRGGDDPSEASSSRNYYRERGELVPHEAKGVWIATNLWKKMRKELELRERQVEDLQTEHKQELLKLIESTNHVDIRNRDLTDQVARIQNIHLQKQKQLEDQITSLHSRLDSAIRSSEKQKFEHEAEVRARGRDRLLDEVSAPRDRDGEERASERKSD